MVKWYVDSDFASLENNKASDQSNLSEIEAKGQHIQFDFLSACSRNGNGNSVRGSKSSVYGDDASSLSFKIEEITSLVDASFTFGDISNEIKGHSSIAENTSTTEKINGKIMDTKSTVLCNHGITQNDILDKNTNSERSKSLPHIYAQNNSPQLSIARKRIPSPPTEMKTVGQRGISSNKVFRAHKEATPPICRRCSGSSSIHDPTKRRALVDLIDFDVNTLLDDTYENKSSNISTVKYEFEPSKPTNNNYAKRKAPTTSVHGSYRSHRSNAISNESSSNSNKFSPNNLSKRKIINRLNFDNCIQELERWHSSKNVNSVADHSNNKNGIHKNISVPSHHIVDSANSNYPPVKDITVTSVTPVIQSHKNVSCHPVKALRNLHDATTNINFSKILKPNINAKQNVNINCINANDVPAIENHFVKRNLLLESLLRTLSSEAWKLESTRASPVWSPNPRMNAFDPESADECQFESKSLIEILESSLNVAPDPEELAERKLIRQVKTQTKKSEPKSILRRLQTKDFEKLRERNQGRRWTNVVSTNFISYIYKNILKI